MLPPLDSKLVFGYALFLVKKVITIYNRPVLRKALAGKMTAVGENTCS